MTTTLRLRAGAVLALSAAALVPALAALPTTPASAASAPQQLLLGLPITLPGVDPGTLPAGTLDPGQLTSLVTQLETLTPSELDSVVGALTPEQVTQLLTNPSPQTLTTLLGGLDASGLQQALATLTPQELQDALAAMTPAELQGLLGTLEATLAALLAGGAPDPAQLTNAIATLQGILGGNVPFDPAALTSLVNGVSALNGLTALLPAGSLDPAQVTALGTRLTGLLGGLDALLGSPPPGLDTAGLSTAAGGLLTTVNGLFRTLGLPPLTPTNIQAIPGPQGPAGPSGPSGPSGPAGPAGPVVQQPSSGTARAIVRRVRISRDRRSVRVTIACPSTAPTACAVRARVLVGRSAITGTRKATIARATTRSMTLRVTPKGRKRVRRGARIVARVVTGTDSASRVSSRSLKVAKTRR